ncbi:MAG: cytochrome c oxidase accessory protein CcoG, partial [Parvularculaceae bacterium]|nr:cytochrome c oxidase accessory protein CcoG [Parvularculaceae bacterium]
MLKTDLSASRTDAAVVEKHDVAAVNSAAARTLYKAREPIYPKLVHGKFRALKWAILAFSLGVYYLLPWLRWPRGLGEPDQAVLVDFPGRRFYFFFIEIWPDELYYLTGLLILAALGLFLATSLFGRVWCGYACPQTVWTDLYIAVERLIEGDRNKRIKLSKSPWTGEKVAKKTAKHALWLLIAAATGGAWIFYFHDAPTIFPQIFRGEAPGSVYLFIGILTFTTYMLAGSMREQVCTYMCPWPRIQAALTDSETLQVTYKFDRGEPRGSHKKGESWEGRGDCVDCNACVAACPMGIDIRDGAQLECINCALCIDACDETMKKIGRPLGLIGYDTDKNIARREAGQKQEIKLLRTRTVLYSVLIAALGALMLVGLTSRATMEVNVIRDRTPPFVKLSDGSVRNAYTVKIINKANAARNFIIRFENEDGVEMSAVGGEVVDNAVEVTANGDAVRSVRIFATLPAAAFMRADDELRLVVEEAGGGERVVNKTAF